MINQMMIDKIDGNCTDADYILRAYGIDRGSKLQTPDGRIMMVHGHTDWLHYDVSVNGAHAIYDIRRIATALRAKKLTVIE